MSAASLLADNPNPSNEEINAAMQGNICRCGMCGRIKGAINRVAGVGISIQREEFNMGKWTKERSLQRVLWLAVVSPLAWPRPGHRAPELAGLVTEEGESSKCLGETGSK